MIEKIVLEYLQQNIAVPCGLEVPKTPPESFIVIEKTGSGRRDRIMRATLAIQSYAGSMVEAIELNENVKNAMFEIISLPEIGACELNSDYNFTDTASKRYRYQAVFDITHY